MTIQRGLSNGYDTDREARRASREMAVTLIDTLKSEGFTRFAPPLAGGFDGAAWDEFADCRVMVAWIEPHAMTEYAGKFVARVDTLARK